MPTLLTRIPTSISSSTGKIFDSYSLTSAFVKSNGIVFTCVFGNFWHISSATCFSFSAVLEIKTIPLNYNVSLKIDQ